LIFAAPKKRPPHLRSDGVGFVCQFLLPDLNLIASQVACEARRAGDDQGGSLTALERKRNVGSLLGADLDPMTAACRLLFYFNLVYRIFSSVTGCSSYDQSGFLAALQRKRDVYDLVGTDLDHRYGSIRPFCDERQFIRLRNDILDT